MLLILSYFPVSAFRARLFVRGRRDVVDVVSVAAPTNQVCTDARVCERQRTTAASRLPPPTSHLPPLNAVRIQIETEMLPGCFFVPNALISVTPIDSILQPEESGGAAFKISPPRVCVCLCVLRVTAGQVMAG